MNRTQSGYRIKKLALKTYIQAIVHRLSILYLGISIYAIYIHDALTLNEKNTMSLKENKEEYMRRLGERKERGRCNYNIKNEIMVKKNIYKN